MKLKDKRGFISLSLAGGLIPLALAIIAIFLIIALFAIGWFLQANLFTLIGGAILILTIVFGFKSLMQNPTQNRIAVFMMFIILSGIIMVIPFFSDVFQFSVGSSTFVKPSWARLECAPTDAYEGSYYDWVDNKQLYPCDAFTEECEVTVENQDTEFWAQYAAGDYWECDLNGNNCGPKLHYTIDPGKKVTFPKIDSGKSYKFNTGFWITNEDYTRVDVKWKPWKLYRFVGGAKWVVNSENCDIKSSSKSRIRDEDYVNKLYRQGGEGTKWINYVDDWNYGPPTNVFNHPRYGEVYCTAGQIFEIVTLAMSDGSLKKVDPSYSETLPSGDRLNGLGSRIDYVECCPNEPRCGDDFQYIPEPEPEPDECYSDVECYNAGGPVPIDGTHYVKYQCKSGTCQVSNPIAVECTTSAQCPSGEICDLSTTNYGKCISQSASEYCGDNICQITESEETCPVDCNTEKISCQEQGGRWSVTSSKPWWSKIPGFGSFAKEEVTERCLIPHVSVMAVVLLILGFVAFILGLIKKMPIAMIPASLLILIGAIWAALAGAGYV